MTNILSIIYIQRKKSAHERQKENFRSGEWATGKKWADDAPKEEVDPDSASLISSGACGAFVHGLEDEFLGEFFWGFFFTLYDMKGLISRLYNILKEKSKIFPYNFPNLSYMPIIVCISLYFSRFFLNALYFRKVCQSNQKDMYEIDINHFELRPSGDYYVSSLGISSFNKCKNVFLSNIRIYEHFISVEKDILG